MAGKSKFEKSEESANESAKENLPEKKLSPEEKEAMLGEMETYKEGLKDILWEKQEELHGLENAHAEETLREIADKLETALEGIEKREEQFAEKEEKEGLKSEEYQARTFMLKHAEEMRAELSAIKTSPEAGKQAVSERLRKEVAELAEDMANLEEFIEEEK